MLTLAYPAASRTSANVRPRQCVADERVSAVMNRQPSSRAVPEPCTRCGSGLAARSGISDAKNGTSRMASVQTRSFFQVVRSCSVPASHQIETISRSATFHRAIADSDVRASQAVRTSPT